MAFTVVVLIGRQDDWIKPMVRCTRAFPIDRRKTDRGAVAVIAAADDDLGGLA
jgi:hypothetical protein